MRRLLRFTFVAAVGFGACLGALPSRAAEPDQISDTAMAQISALHEEKLSRSPVHQKLDPHFIFKLKRDRNQISNPALTNLPSHLEFQTDGRVLVDIEAQVTDALLAQIQHSGGTIRSSVPAFHAIRALVSLNQLESLAARGEVKFIRRAIKGHRRTGSVDSQGDAAHGAITARSTFGVSGAGVKVGVLSDSIDYLSNSQASGDLGPVTVLPGQDGTPGTGEGTAMLEIVHDLAPGAQLFFATAGISEASFAQNILDLRSAGCDIIVDDFGYGDESPFQDGPIAQAVNTVTASGALYFSAAGNDGNLDKLTSSTWEGDFVDGGAVGSVITGSGFNESGGRMHKFGAVTYDRVLSSSADVVLFWSDPLGAATNDYDLFVLNSAGTQIYDFSNATQDGSQDPFEACTSPANGWILVVKHSGAARFLHVAALSDGNSHLGLGTSGNIAGHQCASNAFCVAAVDATKAYPNPFTTTNVIERFSSDGPRKVFFNADGSAITPGNFSSTGGTNRLKPDITAADGVSSSVPGFTPFYGTSAAAPHAAAIAALLKSYQTNLSSGQIRACLTNTALDIMSAGWDRDSGSGIVMAAPALQAAPPPPPMILSSLRTRTNFTFTWSTSSGHKYQPQYTSNVKPAVWNNLGSVITASNTSASVFDSLGTNHQRFYRVLLTQ